MIFLIFLGQKKHYYEVLNAVKLTGKMVIQRSKEKMRKGFEDRMKRHCNEMQTVKLHKKLVEEDDKDF